MLNDLNTACGQVCRAAEQVRHLDDMMARTARDRDAGVLKRTAAQMAADFGRKESAATGNLLQADSALQRSVDALAKNTIDAALASPAARAIRASVNAVALVNQRLPAIQAGATALLSGNVNLGAALSRAADSVSEKLGLASMRIGTLAGGARSPQPALSTAMGVKDLKPGIHLGSGGSQAHLLILMARNGESFYLNLSTAAYDTLRRQSSYNIASQDRLTRRPALQAVSKGGETITVSGAIFTKQVGADQLNRLRGLGFAMAPLMLTTGYGEALGEWYLTRIEEEQSAMFADGMPRKQSFTLEFQRYGEDYSDI